MAQDKYWLRPPAVQAPAPDDRTKLVTYKISEHLTYTLAAASRLSPIFQLWAHVVGELPPINNVSRLSHGEVIPTLTKLTQSVACFKGVKRPYDDELDGASVVVYVLNPTVTLDREVSLVCLAKAVTVPADTCLTVQVKLPQAALQPSGTSLNTGVTRSSKPDVGVTEDNLIHGVVTRLEFVEGDGGNPVLPKRHTTRYHLRMW
jgi:hypothetical protein